MAAPPTPLRRAAAGDGVNHRASGAIRIVEDASSPSREFDQLVDRLAVSMGKLGDQREDVLQLVARVMWAQHPGFHGSCSSLHYDEPEMARRDLRGANNPSLAMFVLRLLERPREMRDALAILAERAGCRVVVDDTPALRVHEAKAELQIAHAELQVLIDRSFSDGHMDTAEKSEISSKLIDVTDRVARVGRSIKDAKDL